MFQLPSSPCLLEIHPYLFGLVSNLLPNLSEFLLCEWFLAIYLGKSGIYQLARAIFSLQSFNLISKL